MPEYRDGGDARYAHDFPAMITRWGELFGAMQAAGDLAIEHDDEGNLWALMEPAAAAFLIDRGVTVPAMDRAVAEGKAVKLGFPPGTAGAVALALLEIGVRPGALTSADRQP